MKRMKVYAVAVILVAAGSAFATKAKPVTSAQFLSTKNGSQNCDDDNEGTINECGGSGATCKLSNITYFAGDACTSPLKLNN